jgi:glutamate racemase
MGPLNGTPRILVFDSGVGGLSILAEIRQRLPACQFIYASDNAAFPYGVKSEAELVARVDQVLHALLARHPADILVMACNTASTLTLPHIRSRFSQPIVGVVPAIKPAAARSRSKVIGLLATPATIARPYTQALIDEHAAQCQVIRVGSSDLVRMAEACLRGQTPDPEALAHILAPFKAPEAQKLDTLVLACTHFPLLRQFLAPLLPGVDLVDSGEAIARRVEYLLGEHFGLRQEELTRNNASEHLALFTRNGADVEALRQPLANFAIEQLQVLSLPYRSSHEEAAP